MWTPFAVAFVVMGLLGTIQVVVKVIARAMGGNR